LVLLLAFLARENTLLVFLVAAGLAWFRGLKRMALQTGGVLAASLAIYSLVCRVGQPNKHHLPDFIYQALRVPYYLGLNFFGFRVWSDVRSEYGKPFVTWHLPHWLKLGDDNVLGLAYPDWRYPEDTAVVLLTVFGLGPLILYFLLRKNGKPWSLPFAVELALIYGVASYLAGPLLGDWVDRIVGFGWPAFWIAMPCLFYAGRLRIESRAAALLAACYSIACWWPRFFGYGNDRSRNPWPCFGVLVFYLVGAFILRQSSQQEAAAGRS
jgi:hypothetical protein